MDATAHNRRLWWRMIWLSVAGIIISPIVGLLGTVVGMTRAFGELRNASVADPSKLSNAISLTMFSTVVGIIIGVVFLVFLIVSIIRYRRLPKPA
jgi:biopolymer transport protein ExbB